VARQASEADAVLDIFSHADFDTSLRITGPHGGGQAIEALCGSHRAGIRLKPRLVWSEGTRRQAKAARGRKPLHADDAVALVRGRFLDTRSTSVFGRLADLTRARLITDLANEVQTSGER
jgi:hypothetical protein